MRETPVSCIRTGGQRLVLTGGSGGEAVVPLRSPVTLRIRRVTPARPAGPFTGVSPRQSGWPQKAARKSPHHLCHTAPVFPASIHMTLHPHDLYPQATPASTDHMTATDTHTSSPTVQAGLLLAATTAFGGTR